VAQQARIARERQSLMTAKSLFEQSGKPTLHFDELVACKAGELVPAASKLLDRADHPVLYAANEYVVRIRTRRSARSLSPRRSLAAGFARWRCRTSTTRARSCAS